MANCAVNGAFVHFNSCPDNSLKFLTEASLLLYACSLIWLFCISRFLPYSTLKFGVIYKLQRNPASSADLAYSYLFEMLHVVPDSGAELFQCNNH